MLLELTDLNRSIERELAAIVASNMPGKPGQEEEPGDDEDEEENPSEPASK